MPLSKDKKQRLKKLKAAKYNPVKGLPVDLFKIESENIAANNDAEPLSIEFKLGPLPPAILQACMDLFEDNMTQLYRDSSWGLNLKEKRDELDHVDARFLLVWDQKQTLVGYCHFRFDVDDDDEPKDVVVYIYELQVSSNFQRYGIGRRLMEISNEITKKAAVAKVMLTVFDANEPAVRFYERLGYEVDAVSPEETDYKVMSKVV